MNPSARVKLLAGLLGVIFLASLVYLVFEGHSEEEAETKQKETLGKPSPVKGKAPAEEHARCPTCGKELPASGECPYCLIKKLGKSGGKDEPLPAPRLGRYLAYTLVGTTVVLAAVHLGMYFRQRRRFLGGVEEDQLKTRCNHCKRRVRFAARLAGSYGSCPTCKQRIRFDPVADPFG